MGHNLSTGANKMETAIQQAFDAKYISTQEICSMLNVARTTVFFARKTGKLPDGINVGGKTFLWERDKVLPYLTSWKTVLDARRGV